VLSVADAMAVQADAGQAAVDVSGGGGSSEDHSSDDATLGLGIIGTGAPGQNNCTLCAGAITQEVGRSVAALWSISDELSIISRINSLKYNLYFIVFVDVLATYAVFF